MKNEVTRKVLVNVDPQVDFTTGILANKNAVRVIPAIRGKVCYALCNGYAFCPNAHIIVHKECCACLTEETHQTALEAMRLCQVEII